MARRSRGRAAQARAALVRQWAASGESQTAFARRHGVHPRTFWGWCRQGARAAPAFVPVTIVESAAPATVTVTIVWPTGARVEVQGADSGVLLAQAVAALRQAC